MQKTNILFCITKLELGGAQKQLLHILKALDKDAFNVFLFTAAEGLLVKDACALTHVTVLRSRFLERPINPVKDLCAFVELYRTIRKNKIAIVHTHSSKAGIVGRFAAWCARTRGIIHTVHGWSFNGSQPRLVQNLYIALERMAGAVSQRIIVSCDWDREKGLRHGIGSLDKYVLIHYGIEYADFQRAHPGARTQFVPEGTGLVVGSVACLKPQKAPLDFIRVAKLVHDRLPGVHFFLAGDGLLRRTVEAEIASQGLSHVVHLLGWQPDIPAVISSCDVFVLTSLWEGMPVTVLEALASSKPVIATHTGGISEVIKEGTNGFLTEPGKPEALSERLMCVLTDTALREKLARNGPASLSDDYRLQKMISASHDLYSALAYENQVN